MNAFNPSTWQNLAKLISDDESVEFIGSELEKVIDLQRGPAKFLMFLETKFGEQMSELPRPGTRGGNNPEFVKLGADETETSVFAILAEDHPVGAELKRQLADIPSVKEGRTVEESTDHKELTTKFNNLVARFRTAAALYHKFQDANELDGVGAELLTIKRDGKEIPRNGSCVWFYDEIYEEKTVGGRTRDVVKKGKKSVAMSVSSFLKLNFKPFDAKTNPKGYKLDEHQGDMFDAIKATVKKGKDAKKKGEDKEGEKTEDTEAGIQVSDVHDWQTLGDALDAVGHYLQGVNKREIKNLQDEETISRLGYVYDMLENVYMPVIGGRWEEIKEKMQPADKRKAA